MFGWGNLWVDDTRCYGVCNMDGGYEMTIEIILKIFVILVEWLVAFGFAYLSLSSSDASRLIFAPISVFISILALLMTFQYFGIISILVV